MPWSLIPYSNVMWIGCGEAIMPRRVPQGCHIHWYSDRQQIFCTVLQNAISGRYARDGQLEEVVHSLLRYGADVNESFPELGTALHMACQKGKDSIVKNTCRSRGWRQAPRRRIWNCSDCGCSWSFKYSALFVGLYSIWRYYCASPPTGGRCECL